MADSSAIYLSWFEQCVYLPVFVQYLFCIGRWLYTLCCFYSSFAVLMIQLHLGVVVVVVVVGVVVVFVVAVVVAVIVAE